MPLPHPNGSLYVLIMPSRKIYIAPAWSLKLSDLSAADLLVVECGICGKKYRLATHVLHERFEPHEPMKNIRRLMACKKCGQSVSLSTHIERAYCQQWDRPAERQEPQTWVCKTEPASLREHIRNGN